MDALYGKLLVGVIIRSESAEMPPPSSR